MILQRTLGFLMLCWAGLAPDLWAVPSVSGVSGTVSQGSVITVSGSGFGSKPQSAPAVWDDCTAANPTAAGWSGWGPQTGKTDTGCSPDPAAILHYTAPINGVPLPHAHLARYLAGRRWNSYDCGDGNAGYNLYVSKVLGSVTYPETLYFSGYHRVDANYDQSNCCGSADNNYKIFDFAGTGGFMNTENWYDAYQGPTDLSNPVHALNDDAGTSLASPDNNGVNIHWGWSGGTNSSPLGAWVKTEFELRLSHGTDGYFKAWDNGVLVVNYAGPTDNYAAGSREIAFGGYGRNWGANNFRYFADLYFDTTPQRIVIGHGSTWATRGVCEVQIPQTWTDNGTSAQATVRVNQGSFADAASAYVYVVDANGIANTNGFPIAFAGGSGSPTPSPTPSAAISSTATRTRTATPVQSSPTATPTRSATPVQSPSTATATWTATPVQSPSTATPAATPSRSATPAQTAPTTAIPTASPVNPTPVSLPASSGLQVYPNPAHGAVIFRFTVIQSARAEIRIFNIAGRLVAKVFGQVDPAQPALTWNTGTVAPGLYFYKTSLAGQAGPEGKVLIRDSAQP